MCFGADCADKATRISGGLPSKKQGKCGEFNQTEQDGGSNVGAMGCQMKLDSPMAPRSRDNAPPGGLNGAIVMSMVVCFKKRVGGANYLSSGFVVVQIHQIANVSLFLLNGSFGGVDELAGELNAVAKVIAVVKREELN